MKHTIICLAAVAASIQILGDTVLGEGALRGATGTYAATAVGGNAAASAENCDRCTFIGENAGQKASSLGNCIAIGSGALRYASKSSGTVAIGEDELANESFADDTTSINERQLWISKPLDAFCLNPGKESHITNTPLYYVDGTLFLNPRRFSVSGGRGNPPGSYDLYLATDGDDAWDGGSYMRPKRTLDGVWRAANLRTDATNLTCAVFPGTYYLEGTNNTVWAYDRGKAQRVNRRVRFIALDGPKNTCISAPEDNFSRDGRFVSLAVSAFDTFYGSKADPDFLGEGGTLKAGIYRRQTLEGFTVRGFAGTYDPTGGRFNDTAPTFAGFDFRNCVITGNRFTHTGWGKAAVLACRFYDCTISGNVFYHTGGTKACKLFNSCSFERTRMTDNAIDLQASSGELQLWYQSAAFTNAFISMIVPPGTPAVKAFVNPAMATADCTTLLLATTNGTGSFSFSLGTNATNSVYVFDAPPAQAEGVDCVSMSADAFRATHDQSTGIASSIDSPAVRTDGRGDAGCGDSGLAARKAVSVRADIRLVDGSLVLYRDGSPVGTLSVNQIAETASLSATVATVRTGTDETTAAEDDGEPVTMNIPAEN